MQTAPWKPISIAPTSSVAEHGPIFKAKKGGLDRNLHLQVVVFFFKCCFVLAHSSPYSKLHGTVHLCLIEGLSLSLGIILVPENAVSLLIMCSII